MPRPGEAVIQAQARRGNDALKITLIFATISEALGQSCNRAVTLIRRHSSSSLYAPPAPPDLLPSAAAPQPIFQFWKYAEWYVFQNMNNKETRIYANTYICEFQSVLL